MKTTVEITDDLLRAAKTFAARRGTTLRALIEAGLRHVLASSAGRERFVLRDAGVAGQGTVEGVDEGDWDTVRDIIYRNRGS